MNPVHKKTYSSKAINRLENAKTVLKNDRRPPNQEGEKAIKGFALADRWNPPLVTD